MKQPRLLYLVLTSATDRGGANAIRETWAKSLPRGDELVFAGAGSGLSLLEALGRALAMPDWDLLLQLDDQTYALPERLTGMLGELPQGAPIHAAAESADCQAFDRLALARAWPFLSGPGRAPLAGPAAVTAAIGAAGIARSVLPPFFHRNRRIDRILCGAGAAVQDMAAEDLRALHPLVCDAPRRPFEVVAATVGYGDVGLNGFLGYDSLAAILNGRRRRQAISAHAPSLVVLRAPPDLLLEFAGAINDSSPSTIMAEATFRISSRGGEVLSDLGPARCGYSTRWLSLRVPADGRLCLRSDTASPLCCHSLWLWRAPEWERENEAAARIGELLEGGSDDEEIAGHLNRTEPFGRSDWDAQAVRALRRRHGLGVLATTEGPIVLQLYQMMKDVHEVLGRHGIDYWADSGTLLGAVRHEGLIPWDDDLDICIRTEQAQALVEMEPIFHRLGYRLVEHGASWKVFPDAGRPYDPPLPWKFPFLDIFTMRREADRFRYTVDDGCRRDGEPLFLTPDELFPLADYRFGAFSIRGPRSAAPQLESRYGPDWGSVAANDYDHAMETYVGDKRMRLAADDRRPAQPTGPLLDRAGLMDRISGSGESENPLNRDAFLPLLRRWIELCREHGIRYSIYWGTLLGQMRNQRIIPHDQDVDVVVGRAGAETLYGLPRRAAGCVFVDDLEDQPPWREGEVRLVVKRDLVSLDGPRYAHDGRRVPTQVDSCAFNGPLARLVIKMPVGLHGVEYRHLDIDLFTDLSHFKEYPAMDEVDELPELEDRPLEDLTVSCLKDSRPYLVRFYGPDYMTTDHVYRDGRWVRRGAAQPEEAVSEGPPEPFTIVEAGVGWGKVGRRGSLGYEGHRIVVAGVPQQQALSAHAPSQVLLRAAPGLLLELTGAINDSSPVSVGAQASFTVRARSGEVLIALGTARAQHPTEPVRVRVPADGHVVLHAETGSALCCHSVWLWRTPERAGDG